MPPKRRKYDTCFIKAFCTKYDRHIQLIANLIVLLTVAAGVVVQLDKASQAEDSVHDLLAWRFGHEQADDRRDTQIAVVQGQLTDMDKELKTVISLLRGK